MRKLVAVLAVLAAVILPASAQKSNTQLQAEINTNWPDNSTGRITPELLRQTVSDIVNSILTANGCPSQLLGFAPDGITPVCYSPGISPPFTVPNGGTGGTSWTSGVPLLGNGAGALTQGSISGNTSKFATVNGAIATGHCITTDSSGNLVDEGAACISSSSGVNSGTKNQVGYYGSTGAVISGTNSLPVQVGTNGKLNITTYGAIGDGSSHPLSGIYGSLAAAQAVYPFVSDLTQEVDWAATQLAINNSFASNANAAVYCPAVPSITAAYQLSNPIQFQNPLTGSSASAWASGTTYSNSATVLYNGIQWSSLGSGNKGNPPTSVSGYPANLAIAGGSLPFANVTVTAATPAVVTLTGHGFSAGQPLIFLKQTHSDATYGTPALPTGISANTVYYVLSTGLTTNAFEISTTPGGTAVNTSDTGTGVITVSTQVWAWNAVGNSDFSSRVSFVGDPGNGNGGNNNGCLFSFNGYQAPAFVVGGYNGNLVQNVRINGPAANGTPYRCQMPTGAVGIGNIADGAGTHGTVLENVNESGFSVGWQSFAGGSGTLGDSNTLRGGSYNNNCTGILVNSQENFINSAYDVTLNSNNVAASATLGTGLRIFGGNDSSSQGQANSFTISSVSAQNVSNVLLVQATVSSPDGFLTNPMCGYNLQCVYNAFNVVTTHFGVVPLTIDGFNPATGVINLHVNGDWTLPYQNTISTFPISDLEAVTTLYAAEAVTVYRGSDITVTGTHVENASSNTVPTQLVQSFTSFGANSATHLSDVFLDYVASGAQFICSPNTGCNSSPSAALLATFYAQQNLPFVSGPVIIDNLYGGFNIGGMDRVLLEGSGYQEFRHTQASVPPSGNFNGPPQSPGLLWNQRFASNNTFTGNNGGYTGIFGSSGLGGGKWDNGAAWISAASTTGDLWRATEWGASDFYGVKPAPYAIPCITPAQVTALGSAAITFSATLTSASINAGGSNYAQNDFVTLAGGTHSTAAVIQVNSVNSGAITSFSVTTPGTYSVETSTFTQASTTGSGSGATFNNAIWWILYTTGYPMLWGGTQHNVCDYKGGSQTHYGVQSTNLGYSYFTNLTTSNVPNLSWSSYGGSPVVYMNQEALELMFPGLVISLTGSNGGSCPDTAETFIVTEVHPYLGYVTVLNAGQDGSPYLPQWGGGTTCTGTAIGQAATNIVNPY